MGSMAFAPTLTDEEQPSLYAEHAPEGIGLDDLGILGPFLILKVKFAPEDLAPDRRLVTDSLVYRYDPQASPTAFPGTRGRSRCARSSTLTCSRNRVASMTPG